MNVELMRAQLYSARATIDAVLFELDGQSAPAVAPNTGCPKCGAPDEKQVDASTLGGPALKQCRVCRTEYPG